MAPEPALVGHAPAYRPAWTKWLENVDWADGILSRKPERCKQECRAVVHGVKLLGFPLVGKCLLSPCKGFAHDATLRHGRTLRFE